MVVDVMKKVVKASAKKGETTKTEKPEAKPKAKAAKKPAEKKSKTDK
jgi:hypothetical protein